MLYAFSKYSGYPCDHAFNFFLLSISVWLRQPLECSIHIIAEGSLEVKLPTIWTDEKQSREEAEKRKIRREKIREEKE